MSRSRREIQTGRPPLTWPPAQGGVRRITMPQRTVGPRRRPGLTRCFLPLLITAAIVAIPLYASAAYAATGVEVETMTLPTKSGYLLAESAATDGKAFKFLGNGVASKHVTT